MNQKRSDFLGYEKVICPQCGNLFQRTIAKTYHTSYCSKSCAQKAKWEKSNLRQKMSVKTGERKRLICEWCENEFEVLFSQVENGDISGKYCSHSCASKANWANRSKEEQEKQVRGLKKHCGDSKGRTPWNKGLTKETDDRVREYGEKGGDSRRGKTLSKTHIENVTKAIKGLKRSEKSIKNYCLAAQKRCREDTEYWRRLHKSLNIQPNNLESNLNSLLQSLFPNEYEFVGDFSFILGGKCPDFMNVNGQKKLIEAYGDYWHKNDDPQDRINHFKQFGFDTLIVWEHEFKDKNKLIPKLEKFHQKESL